MRNLSLSSTVEESHEVVDGRAMASRGDTMQAIVWMVTVVFSSGCGGRVSERRYRSQAPGSARYAIAPRACSLHVN